MHNSCSFASLQRKGAGGPVCKASPDGGCLPTQGSTLYLPLQQFESFQLSPPAPPLKARSGPVRVGHLTDDGGNTKYLLGRHYE